MKINKKFSIERDSHNFIVVKRIKNKGIKKEGKRIKPKSKYRYTKKFFPSLLLACLHVQKESIDIENIDSILKSLNKATKQILKAV